MIQREPGFSASEERAKRRQAQNDAYRRRHPDRAAEQRALRKHQAGLDDRFGHKLEGTLETLDKASGVKQGSLARMFQNGHISIDQLAWSEEIRTIALSIQREVGLCVISAETRVDNGSGFFKREEQSLGRVRSEMAYTAWRVSLEKPQPVLAMIVEDRHCRPVAETFRMRDVTLRKMLTESLDSWPAHYRDACDRVSEEDLKAARANLEKKCA